MSNKNIDFKDILSGEIENCCKLKCPTWIILFQIERKEDTVFKKKVKQTEDWVEHTLKEISLWGGMVRHADLYGSDKIAVIPNASSEEVARNIANKIADHLTIAKQRYNRQVFSIEMRKVVFGIVQFDPLTHLDKTADHLLEEAIDALWHNRLI